MEVLERPTPETASHEEQLSPVDEATSKLSLSDEAPRSVGLEEEGPKPHVTDVASEAGQKSTVGKLFHPQAPEAVAIFFGSGGAK